MQSVFNVYIAKCTSGNTFFEKAGQFLVHGVSVSLHQFPQQPTAFPFMAQLLLLYKSGHPPELRDVIEIGIDVGKQPLPRRPFLIQRAGNG